MPPVACVSFKSIRIYTCVPFIRATPLRPQMHRYPIAAAQIALEGLVYHFVVVAALWGGWWAVVAVNGGLRWVVGLDHI